MYQVECLCFLPIANEFAAPKLDAVATVQAATIISFSVDIVTFCLRRSGLVRYRCGLVRVRLVEFELISTRY